MCYKIYFWEGCRKEYYKDWTDCIDSGDVFVQFPNNKNGLANCKLWVQLCDLGQVPPNLLSGEVATLVDGMSASYGIFTIFGFLLIIPPVDKPYRCTPYWLLTGNQ